MEKLPTDDRGRRTVRAASSIARTLIAESAVPITTIRKILDTAYEDDDHSWETGDAHEACELAVTHLLFSLSRLMNQHAKGPEDLDEMITKTTAVEPRLRGTSQRHDRLQHHATPLEIAWAMAVAADIKPGDKVLDPSAGTGILLGMAHMAQPDASLRGNEADPRRAEMLRMTAPKISVACTDSLAPTQEYPDNWGMHDIVLLNPPFSARLGSTGRHRDEGLHHVLAAKAATQPYGRIIALLSGGVRIREKAWKKIIGDQLRLVWACRIDPKLTPNRSANTISQICILENTEEDNTFDPVKDLDYIEDANTLMLAAREM